jgi:hypothetical protein
MPTEKEVWVLDYDVPYKGNYAKHRAFYRAISKVLADHFGEKREFSSMSCYITRSPDLARKMHAIAKIYANRCHLYRAEIVG